GKIRPMRTTLYWASVSPFVLFSRRSLNSRRRRREVYPASDFRSLRDLGTVVGLVVAKPGLFRRPHEFRNPWEGLHAEDTSKRDAAIGNSEAVVICVRQVDTKAVFADHIVVKGRRLTDQRPFGVKPE